MILIQTKSHFLATFHLLCLHLFLRGSAGTVIECEPRDNGKSIRCLKDESGRNGDDLGRVGIINKSQCQRIRYIKQEWTLPCGVSNENGTLQRSFPGEALKFGDFQVDMVPDFIQRNSCGELKILQCYCGPMEMVPCSEVLYAATYRRGEHGIFLKKFQTSLLEPKQVPMVVVQTKSDNDC